MDQYSYRIEEIPKMLFTELVLAYAISDDNFFKKEINRRLEFCGFEEQMMSQLITYELEILKATKRNFTDLLVNKKWWLDPSFIYSNRKLLPLPLEKYLLYYNGKMSENALTSSEIISIYDEANFILANNIKVSDEIISECTILSSGESKKNLKDEFIHRVDYIYERELGVKYNPEVYKKVMRFFINESHILFINKYNYDIEECLKWQPYTSEFFKYFDY